MSRKHQVSDPIFQVDVPLAETGVAEANRAALNLKEEGFTFDILCAPAPNAQHLRYKIYKRLHITHGPSFDPLVVINIGKAKRRRPSRFHPRVQPLLGPST